MLKSIFENTIFALLLVILAITISPVLPLKNIPRTYVVVSGSMEPHIKTGSIVLTKPIVTSTVKVGDIIAFTSPNNKQETILHRIYSIKSESPLLFQTKGDNNNSPDAWDLPSHAILGKQILSIPYIGHLTAFVKTPLGFVVLIVIPALLFVLFQIINIQKYIKDEIDKSDQNKATVNKLIIFFLLATTTIFTKSILSKLNSVTPLSGVTFSIKHFISPTVPTNLSWVNPNVACGGFTNSHNITANWSDSFDSVGVLKYMYEITYPKIGGGTDVWSRYVNNSQYSGVFNQAEGLHTYRVRAYNTDNYLSSWSDTCSIIYDITPPTSEITNLPYVTNSSSLDISYSATDNFAVDHTNLCYSFNNEDTYLCQPSFQFDFPKGQGVYYFYTQAFDKAGNVESKSTSTNSIIFDQTSPTTVMVINSQYPHYEGKSLLTNNWTYNGNYLSVGTSTLLGIGDSDSVDSMSQTLNLPQNVSLNLSFNYNFTTTDISEYDYLSVGISSSSGITDLFNFGGFTSGWQTITRSLSSFAGKTVMLFFKLVNSGQSNPTSVVIDNIDLSPIDLRIGNTAPTEFIATDLGSDIFSSTTLPETITSTDLAGNIENAHSISVVTLPPVVLNKISSSSVTLYNNTDSTVDLSTYTIDIGTTNILSGTVPSLSSVVVPLAIGTTKVSLLNNYVLIDSTIFEPLGTAIWARQSDGLGPWTRLNAPFSFDLQSRLSESKVTFTASGLGDTLVDMNYAIYYTNSFGLQQIAGQIPTHTIDYNGTVSRDFFLGTCSSGTCLPATDIGSSFQVTFSGVTKIFILN